MDVVGDDPQAASQAKCAVRAQAIALCHVGMVWWVRGVGDGGVDGSCVFGTGVTEADV